VVGDEAEAEALLREAASSQHLVEGAVVPSLALAVNNNTAPR
jgi:hypothetical protein